MLYSFKTPANIMYALENIFLSLSNQLKQLKYLSYSFYFNDL